MKVKKLKALKRHIRSLKQNDELFKKTEHKILSVNVSNDLKQFEFKFDEDKNDEDIFLEIGNKTSIVNQLNHLIDITELNDILNGKTSTI